MSHPGCSHTARMSGEFDSRKDLQSSKFKQKPQIFVKLSVRGFFDSKLSGLHAFDNMTIIHQVYMFKNRQAVNRSLLVATSKFGLLTVRWHSATGKHLFLSPQGDRSGLRKPKKDKHQH